MVENKPLWDDSGWAGLPTLTGEVETHLCVVGLGGSGLTAVNAALEWGVPVVGIDAATVGFGAAGRNGGLLIAGMARFHHDAVKAHGRICATALYQRTLTELDRLVGNIPRFARRTGSLRIAESDAEYADCLDQLVAMHEDGLDAELYDGPEGRGLLFPHDAVFHPLVRCRTLARHAQGHGVRLYENSPAIQIEGNCVTTPQGTIRCQHVVVAVDGNLERLIPELQGRVRTTRLQMLGTAPTAIRFTRPVYSRYGYDYWQQLPDGRVGLGGFRDQFMDEEWTDSTEPSAPIQGRLEHHLRHRLNVGAPITHRWGASVSYTEDGLPICEEVRPGVLVIGAYSGTGNLVGSLLGRRAVQWHLNGSDPLFDLITAARHAVCEPL